MIILDFSIPQMEAMIKDLNYHIEIEFDAEHKETLELMRDVLMEQIDYWDE